MRRVFDFRDDAVAYLQTEGFLYCHTLGWFGWWHREKNLRAIVDFNGSSRGRSWVVTTWKTDPRNMPPSGADFKKVA